MIKDRVIVSRYAEALFAFVKGKISIEKILQDLKNIKQVVCDNSEFKQMLERPEVTFSDKCRIIDEVLGLEVSGEVRDFLRLLIEKGRAAYLLDIIEYARMKYSHLGISEAVIKTTFLLELPLLKRIEEAVERRFNKKFKFYIDLDSSLLGGIQVAIGNTIIDGSVKRRLEGLKEKLLTAQLLSC